MVIERANVRRRAFGPGRRQVAVVGQGTWNMELDGERAAVTALRRGIELGLTHIDTAEMYGRGEVERIVGKAIRGRREEVYLASKVLPENASRRGTIEACERSLKRLGTDWLDLYLLHWPGEHPLGDTLQAFAELEQAGKIRAFGVSNFDEIELAQAVSIAGKGRIACNQVLYHLQQRAVEQRVLPFCKRHAIALVAYSPFGQGDFPGPRSSAGRVLAAIGRAHAATPHQVALAFLSRHPNVFVIPKASKIEHVEENAKAGELVLSSAQIERIDAALPRGPARAGLPML